MVHIKESRSIYTLESGGGNPVHIYMIVLHCYTTPIATDICKAEKKVSRPHSHFPGKSRKFMHIYVESS